MFGVIILIHNSPCFAFIFIIIIIIIENMPTCFCLNLYIATPAIQWIVIPRQVSLTRGNATALLKNRRPNSQFLRFLLEELGSTSRNWVPRSLHIHLPTTSSSGVLFWPAPSLSLPHCAHQAQPLRSLSCFLAQSCTPFRLSTLTVAFVPGWMRHGEPRGSWP